LNGERQLVGFDVEMAQLLARDLGVKVEFVEMEDLTELARLLATGWLDVAMAGMVVTPERASEMLFSQPYLDETLAFLVRDQLREEFSSWANIRDLGAFPVAIPDSPYYIDRVRARAGTEAPGGGYNQTGRGWIEKRNIRRRSSPRRARIGADFAQSEIHGRRA
jgi:ABC-type amino acid transport substrate-binding protein